MEKAIKETARSIAEQFKPEKIILFGSWAWGNPGPDSDMDLLVVQNTSLPKRERAYVIRQSFKIPMPPMDLLVYTPTEIEEKINNDRNLFLEDIINNGKVLYASN